MNRTVKKSKILLSKQNALELISRLKNDYIPRCDSLLKKEHDSLPDDGTYQSLITYVKAFIAEKRTAAFAASTKPIEEKAMTQPAVSPRSTVLKNVYQQNQKTIAAGKQNPLIVTKRNWTNDYCVFITQPQKGMIVGHAYIGGKLYQPYWMRPEDESGYSEYTGPSREAIIQNEIAMMKESAAMQAYDKGDSCDKCLYARKGDCFSNKLCKDYISVDIPKEVIEKWPKMGDATYLRMKGVRKQNQ